MLDDAAVSSVTEAKKTLESVLSKLGLDPAALKVAEDADRVAYRLRRGSADVLVAVASASAGSSSKGYVRVVAPVLVPPEEKEKRAALFEHVLTLNARGLSNAAFGLLDGRLIVVSERPTEGLDADELEQMLKHLSAVADTFDDRLVEAFGGELASKG